MRRQTSFWRYTLRQELLALALLGGASWLSVEALNRRTIRLQRSEADQVGLQLESHLEEARKVFVAFARLGDGERKRLADLLFRNFSDLYRLDGEQRVVAIYKQQPGSRVFVGFSFAGSRLAEQLHQRLASAPRSTVPQPSGPQLPPFTSAILRSAEDDLASVYLALPDGDGTTLLGRVDLSYIQTFLERFAALTGSPLLLVSNEGLVMLSSDPSLPLATLDLARLRGRLRPQPISAAGERWLPLVGQNNPEGGTFVTLLSTRPLEQQWHLLTAATVATASLLTALALWKSLRLRRNLFLPFKAFAAQLRRLESGRAAPRAASEGPPSPSPFLEMELLQDRFAAMVAAIEQRERDLRAALNTSLTAAAIGHEIKQPLSSIRLLCQQAQRAGGDPALTPLLSALDRESQRLATTVERMRMLLRNVQTDHQALNLASVVLAAITLTRPQLRAQGVRLEVEGLAGAPLQACDLPVSGDAVQLQVAVANLLRNAAEVLAERPADQRRVRVLLRQRPPGPQHPHGLGGVEVADSGPGLMPLLAAQGLAVEGLAEAPLPPGPDLGDQLGRRPLRSHKAAGSGLGLFVVRTTLEHHGGWLEAAPSADLGGVALSLWLPLMAPGAL